MLLVNPKCNKTQETESKKKKKKNSDKEEKKVSESWKIKLNKRLLLQQQTKRVLLRRISGCDNDISANRYLSRLENVEVQKHRALTILPRTTTQGRTGSVCVGCCTGQNDGSMQLAERGQLTTRLVTTYHVSTPSSTATGSYLRGSD